MKTLTLTALVTALLVLPFVLRRQRVPPLSIQSDEEKRYDVDDYIAN